MIKKLLLLTFLLSCLTNARAAYIPIAVTGYNADVVANGSGPATGSTTADFDAAGYALMDATFNPSASIFPTRFMPTGGVINSATTAGVTFNLASYSSNNSLRITALNTDSLVFPAPTAASEVYVLAATGSGSCTVNITLNFTDGTNQLYTSTAVADWYSGSSYAILGLGRTNINTTANGIDNDVSNPRLYEHKLVLSAANAPKQIRSIKFVKLSTTGVLNVMGITINSPAAPSCITAPNSPANAGSVCGGSVILNWPAAAGASGYDVYLNSGSTATTVVATNQTGTTYTATLTPGTYAWKIIPKNANGSATGCATYTFTATATVTPSVTIAAVPAGSVCAGTPVTFTATPVNGGTTPAYQWKKGTTNVGTNSATYTSSAPANGDAISVVMTSNAVCPSPATSTSTSIILSVLPRPAPSITAASDTSFCAGGSVLLNTPTGTGYTYIWLRNNTGITPAATTSSYTASVAGQYRVVVSNGVCADTSAAKTVTVNPVPAATVTPAGPLAVCSNSSVVLSTPSATGYTYQWKNGTTILTGETNNTYTAATAGNYTVTISSLGCTGTSAPVAVTVNPTPGSSATAAGLLSFCQGGSVTLLAGSSTPIGVTYQWLRNNAIITGAIAASYSANASGDYRVRVINTATGCADTSAPAITVNVSTATSNVVTQTGNSPVCQGGNIRFQSQNPTTYTFQWYKDGLPIPGATTFFYTATTAGAYYVVVTNGTCTSTSVARTVAVNPLPAATATATGATAFCEGGFVRLDANAGTGLTYQWRRNAGILAGETAATYTATQTGSYSVTVTNSATGCSATSAPGVNINVSTMPVAVITAIGPVTFCQGNAVTLNATAGAGYTYQWQLNGSNISGASAASYIANTSGNYTVTITNGTCVAASPAFNISVTPAPLATIAHAGPVAFCQGGSVTLNANRGSGLTYQWTLNGVNIAGATNAQYTAVTSGTYSLNLSDGTCPAKAPDVVVTVNRFPLAVITVTGGVNLSTDVFSAYQWYRNGIAIAGAIYQNYTATHDGYYAVVVSDTLGCTATSAVQRITSLDIHSVQGSGIVKLYPNPSEGMVMVDADVPTDLVVMGIDGKELLNEQSAKRIDIGSLAQGLYLIKVINHSTGQLISLQKIIRK